ncbi:inosine/xanthosine triphosphatase [Halorubrum alkaliphilum]|uniref:Probable inosine/xanthosine triphosphatase n=1 Tax=Halorubrum alkaliphilum TaxID=261290 RepID=A0A8T4GJX8_9EURY|nr:inosine/xanthosine triphosphatase [Halorubrum alkaliphilum]MBP1923890.1 inosine/xanthosine triphosphatase [Halorubrum alkaliphilum]
MRIGVGSGNPVKRRAVERALETAEGDGRVLDAGVESVPVQSGVSEQPVGHAETVTGAENRATAALDAGVYDLGVGIEGGVARFTAADGLFLVMWAVATDGDRVGRGSGPSLRLPDRIAARVDEGEELGPVMDDVLGVTGVAKRGGAAGALTAGSVDRADALSTAVAGALGPFVSDQYE